MELAGGDGGRGGGIRPACASRHHPPVRRLPAPGQNYNCRNTDTAASLARWTSLRVAVGEAEGRIVGIPKSTVLP